MKNSGHINSKHFSARMQQRGIETACISLVLGYGKCRRSNGADVFDVDRECQKRLQKDLPDLSLKTVEKLTKLYVVAIDDRLITVGHKQSRFRRKFGSGKHPKLNRQ